MLTFQTSMERKKESFTHLRKASWGVEGIDPEILFRVDPPAQAHQL